MSIRELDRDNLGYHLDRIRALRADTPARWGGMDAQRMLAHLRALTDASMGEPECEQFLSPLIGWPLGMIFFYVYPRPPRGKKGSKPPIPALVPKTGKSFEEEQALLLESMERFVAMRSESPERRTRHPLMGKTTLQRWSRVHGVHNRHHYRQFGLEQ